MTTPPDTTDCGCDEYRSFALSRRGLLGATALAGGMLALSGRGDYAVAASGRSTAMSQLAADVTTPVLVMLSLRGAADGMSLVVPHGDPVYYSARPRIAVPAASLLVPDTMFGLHPAMNPLLPLWNSGKLAAVHATGMPVANRSHFSAMEEIEDADPGSRERSGWLNRLLGEMPGSSVLQGVAMGSSAPTSMFGTEPAFVVGSVNGAKVAGIDKEGRRLASLNNAWKGNRALGRAVNGALGGSAAFGPAHAITAGKPEPAYPSTSLGRALTEASRIVKAGIGAEIITVDQGDWDMHTDMGGVESGWMSRNAADLAGSIASFFADLGPAAERVTLVTLSEFGRRVRENDDWGTDHGHGNVMLVAGAGVKGGYHGRWPGLADTHDADVAVTTDYRHVLAEVASRRFGVSTAAVFPGFSAAPIGVMA